MLTDGVRADGKRSGLGERNWWRTTRSSSATSRCSASGTGSRSATGCAASCVAFDVSQAFLAEVLGISAPMLSQVMSGRRAKIGNPVVLARMIMLERKILVPEVAAGNRDAMLAAMEDVRDSRPTVGRDNIPVVNDDQKRPRLPARPGRGRGPERGRQAARRRVPGHRRPAAPGGPRRLMPVLFSALLPPDDVVEAVAEALGALGEPGDGLRWEPPERWHVTLAYYGQDDVEARAAWLADRLAGRPRRRRPAGKGRDVPRGAVVDCRRIGADAARARRGRRRRAEALPGPPDARAVPPGRTRAHQALDREAARASAAAAGQPARWR